MEVAALVSTRHEQLFHRYPTEASQQRKSTCNQKAPDFRSTSNTSGRRKAASQAAAVYLSAVVRSRGLESSLASPPLAEVAGGQAERSTTPRVMKDEILTSAAGATPSTEGVGGGWQPVPSPDTKATAEVPSEEPAAPPPPPPETSSQLDPRAPVRKGKWTPEEEVYTTRIINDFNKGLLPLAPGTTLRSYLSEKLNCDPMRITKKFAGASCIGKRVFMPIELTPENVEETARSRRDLEEMARKFHIRLESMRPGGGGGNSGRSNSGSSSKGASSSNSSPKTRKSSASVAGTGGGGGAACGTAKASQGGGGARRGEIVAPSLSGAGAEGDGEGGVRRERSPSPGAHGPHSACDDSAPHPEGSPSRRQASSWEERDDADGEGYGHYDPMDQSLDSDASSSSSRATGYPGRVQQPPPGGGGGGGGYGGAAVAAATAEYSMHGDRRDHVMGYDRCQWDERLSGVDGAVG
ncbi:unnamed protein product, partial [Sphacelaria rigidula]